MLIDIDHFKSFNDHYGHQAGDDALKAVANVIRRSAQRPLDFAARFGGEEFALILYSFFLSVVFVPAGSLRRVDFCQESAGAKIRGLAILFRRRCRPRLDRIGPAL